MKNTMLALGAALVLTVAGCSSDSDSDSTATEAATDAGSSAVETCPDAPGKADASPQWTLAGATGELKVVAATANEAPKITVEAPFKVDETEVETLVEGDGEIVPENATVTVCYVGVNGRTGEEFDGTYRPGGSPATFSLDGVIAGFSKAIAGQKVGSQVAVAMTSADGYAQGQPAAGIEPGDTLVFEIGILSAS
ncbi:FKBP-type peptidyl-prolyl cis-trans isomerase [Gordonia aurantiaca]|uniref:FKBP-type peptidyl-prolyl cis-trans isomerase n=1 Tax=Gordonia sp. B21 TaxID=3151852 RepID=UPI003267940F